MARQSLRTIAGLLGGTAIIIAGCRAAPTPGAGPVQARAVNLTDTTWPATPMGASIRRGHALFANTRDSLPQYALSGLRCFSCHLDEGARKNGLLLLGVYARFPQYRARSGHVDLITDRVNDCFRRSLNGHPIPSDGVDMRDMVAYLAWISRGVRGGDSMPGQGLAKLPPLSSDSARGAAVFGAICARCHGANGAGIAPAPPLWGTHSFNIGAGMGRRNNFTSFVRYNMPFDKPGSLTDQQAYDVAAFVLSHPRPDLAGKENDWPNGDPPPDVAYPTTAAKRKTAAAERSTPTSAH
jgi:thiosulfate dehydrogenase